MSYDAPAQQPAPEQPTPESPATEPLAPDPQAIGSALAQAERTLDDVDRALVRIADGKYASCEVCGQPIGTHRLEADPTLRVCDDHVQPA